MRRLFGQVAALLAVGAASLFAVSALGPTLVSNVVRTAEPAAARQAEVLNTGPRANAPRIVRPARRLAGPESSQGVVGGRHAGADSPSVLVAEPAGIDMGTVLKGETVDCVFTLQNPGSDPVTITAKPSCGCTVAQYDAMIPAGGTGRVTARLKTAGLHTGRLRKSITVTTNEPHSPVLHLRLEGTLVPVVELLPESEPVIVLQDNGPTVCELFLAMHGQAADGGPGEVTGVNVRVPYLTAHVEPIDVAVLPAGVAGVDQSDAPATLTTVPSASGRGGRGEDSAALRPQPTNWKTDVPSIRRAYRVQLVADASAPVGRRRVALIVSTTVPRIPTATLTINYEKGILVNPAVVYISALRSGNSRIHSRSVTLAKRGGTFRVQDVVTGDPNLEVQTETVREGTNYRLTVTYAGAESANGLLRTKIEVHTDDPTQPRIEIPVVSILKPAAPRRPR